VVFNKKAFNRAGYRTVAGEVQTIDLTRTRMHPEHAVTLRPDIPWVTFYNEAGGAAFANLYLDQMMTNVEGGPASATGAEMIIKKENDSSRNNLQEGMVCIVNLNG